MSSTALLISLCQDWPTEGESSSLLRSLCQRARIALATRRAKISENVVSEDCMKEGDVIRAKWRLSLLRNYTLWQEANPPVSS